MRGRRRLETVLPMIAALVAGGCRKNAPPLRPTETRACVDNGGSLLAGISISPKRDRVDDMELREEGGLYQTSERPFTVVGKTGIACARATEQARCEDALGAARSKTGLATRDVAEAVWSSSYLVVNSGDAVEIIETQDDLRAFLAPIDNPEREELRSERASALHDLESSLREEPSPALVEVTGLPRAHEAEQLLTALARISSEGEAVVAAA